MTKDLSKILCKIAGIEAKEVEDLTCEGLEDVCEDCFSSYKCVTPCCCDNPKLEDKVREILSRNKKLVYANFESPENFIRLLECYFETVDGVVNYHKREEFITYIIEIAKDNNKLKQALQATEWVY